MNIVIYRIEWDDFFKRENGIIHNIFSQIENEEFFPHEKDIFRFTTIPPKNIKGVIVGMEPYSSYTVQGGAIIPEATGRSFEVNSVSSWQQKFKQSSLRNFLKAIYDELENDNAASLETVRNRLKRGEVYIPEPHKWFSLMESRGIMFLNSALTVRKSTTGSHLKLWEVFSMDLTRYIAQQSPEACWMLFGKDAQKRIKPVLMEYGCTNIIETCHPRMAGFVKEKPFRNIAQIV